MEFRFDAMLCFHLGNENSDAGRRFPTPGIRRQRGRLLLRSRDMFLKNDVVWRSNALLFSCLQVKLICTCEETGGGFLLICSFSSFPAFSSTSRDS